MLGTGGMVALVYAITRFGEDGFTDPLALALLSTATVLLAVFVLTQAHSSSPLVPLSLFRDRNRSGAYLTMLLIIAPMSTCPEHALAGRPSDTTAAPLPTRLRPGGRARRP